MNEAARHHVVIIQKAARLAPELPEFLHERNFSSQVVTTVPDALKAAERLKHPLLMAYCGSDERNAMRSIEELLNTPRLHSYPLVVLGNAVERHQGRLEARFQAVLALSSPFEHNDIVQALHYVADLWKDSREKGDRAKSRHQKPAPEVAPETFHVQEPAPLTVPVRIEVPSVPLVLFEQMQQSGLANAILGGEKYDARINQDYLETHGYLPAEPLAIDAINDVLRTSDRWSKAHLCRTAFVTNHLIGPLQVENALVQDTRVASLLFAATFVARSPEYVKVNYLRPGKKHFRQQLCSRIKDSALWAASRLGIPRVGEIISGAARLIGQEDPPGNESISIAASSIVAADLADRTCFHSGYWDPRSAYGLLRRIKAGDLSQLNSRVMCCTVKFISEAVANKPCAFLIPKHLRDDPALRAAAEEARAGKITSKEQRVPLSSLQPGMKLARPLVTYDGREILDGDLVLDQDLIWRIWQLAAMRPLNTPLVVREEDD